MEELSLPIMQRIGELMPEIQTIDEDYGQLAYNENNDSYPLVFPAVLIGNIKIAWKTSGSIQQGVGTFTVRLAIDCYDDTHLGSGTEGKVRERQRMHNRLCRCLHYFKPGVNVNPLERKTSEDYTLQGPGNIKVYETVFEVEIVDKTITTPL